MLASYPSPYFFNDKYYHLSKPIDPMKADLSVIHLNGVAGFFRNELGFEMADVINAPDLSAVTREILQVYDKSEAHLNFSWDSDESIANLALNNIKDTEILVIIGYSFPGFNKQIDNKILFGFKNLRKIYIQDMNSAVIKDRLVGRGIDNKKVKIVCETSINSFVIPDELD